MDRRTVERTAQLRTSLHRFPSLPPVEEFERDLRGEPDPLPPSHDLARLAVEIIVSILVVLAIFWFLGK